MPTGSRAWPPTAAFFAAFFVLMQIAADPAQAIGAMSVRYEIRPDPATGQVDISGELRGATIADVTGWRPSGVKLARAPALQSRADGLAFSYTVAAPQAAQANATELGLDIKGLRAWGRHLLLVPQTAAELRTAEVCIIAPTGWSVATTSGAGACTKVDELDSLPRIPLLAGDLEVRASSAAGSAVVVAAPRDHPVHIRQLEASLLRLVAGAADYLGEPPPARVFFGVDLLRGRETYAPGQNMTTRSTSATLLIDQDGAGPHRLKFWGTYAHEFMHTWIPFALGDRAVVRRELGSTFSEGMTDYLAYRVTHASGLHSDRQFAAALSEFLTEYETVGAREPERNAEFLRYRRGMMAAWALDVELLKASGGRSGFREFVRLLLDRHRGGDGLTRAELEVVLRELGGDRVARLYGLLTDPAVGLDLQPHLVGTGMVLRRSDGGLPSVRFEPRSPEEQRFLTRFLAG